jgi:glycosyltransferase involved in cell wall biosynthesis
MHVGLVVTGGVDRSGRERVIPALLWLIERLARRHDVHVYVLRHHETPCEYPLLGATIHDLGRPPGIQRQHAALLDAWRVSRPDVVHAYWALPAGLSGATAARRLRIPSVVTLDSGELAWIPDIGYGLRGSWKSRFAVAAATRMAACVTVCTRQMQARAAACGITAACIPIGVDLAKFRCARPPEGPPWRLLNVASLNPVKDHTTLLRAFRLVLNRLQCRLDIVGEDTLGGRVHRLANDLGLREAVTFSGFQPTEDVAIRLATSHLHVVSSRHEAAGVAILEAAACGVPTIGTRVGYVADWEPDRAVGVPPGNPAALADAIVAALQNGERRRAMAHAAREWATAHDADWTAAAFERLYLGLI